MKYIDQIINKEEIVYQDNRSELPILLYIFLQLFILVFGHIYSNSLIVYFSLFLFFIPIFFLDFNQIFVYTLFYISWAPILKFSPGSTSSFTILIVIIPIIYLLRIYRSRLKVNTRIILFSLYIIIQTLIVSFLTNSILNLTKYILLSIELLLYPILLNYYKNKFRFSSMVLFYTIGILTSSITGILLINNINMGLFIRSTIEGNVDVIISRLSGFIGDPNFFSSLILVGISCNIILLRSAKKVKNVIYEIISLFLLVGFGLTTVSKMFIFTLVPLVIILLSVSFDWDKPKFVKFVNFILFFAIALILINYGTFDYQFNLYLSRFGLSQHDGSFTTGRIEIALSYLEYFYNNISVFFFGSGMTKSYLVHGSHNTIIQLIYQLGVFSAALFGIWVYNLIKMFYNRYAIDNKNLAILTIGILVPWLSIDMLYFESFLIIVIFAIFGLKKADNSERKK